MLIVTTVPITLGTILRHQPRFLASHFEVEVATSAADGTADIETNEGVKVNDVPMKRRIGPLHDLRSIWRMIVLLRRFRPQIVHSYTPKAGLVAMTAAWLCRVPVRIHTFTGLVFPSYSGLRQWALRLFDSLICAMATRVVPEGLGVQRDLVEFGITRKPLHVIGHGNIAGVDTRYFCRNAEGVEPERSALAQRLGTGADAFVFCFVGRLNRDKGLAELLEAFKRLPDRAHLLLVGDEDQTAPLPVAVTAELLGHPRVRALGFLSDVRPALAMSDVLVLPSYREGFPNVLLQAGAMELPVIATDVNGSNEIVEPKVNGWLVPVRDAVMLQEAMLEAMNTLARERAGMGRTARRRIQKRFERSEHWLRVLEFYRKELNEEGV